jgi:hypothetical protein
LAKSEALVAEVKEIEVKPDYSLTPIESSTYETNNKLIVDRVIESSYDANDDDEDLLMLW